METLASYLPAILCLAPVVVLAVGGVVVWSRRREPDTIGWAPAVGAVVDRQRVWRRGELRLRVLVEFRCLHGRTVRFTDEISAWQAGPGDVRVIYDPASPERARLVRRRR